LQRRLNFSASSRRRSACARSCAAGGKPKARIRSSEMKDGQRSARRLWSDPSERRRGSLEEASKRGARGAAPRTTSWGSDRRNERVGRVPERDDRRTMNGLEDGYGRFKAADRSKALLARMWRCAQFCFGQCRGQRGPSRRLYTARVCPWRIEYSGRIVSGVPTTTTR